MSSNTDTVAEMTAALDVVKEKPEKSAPVEKPEAPVEKPVEKPAELPKPPDEEPEPPEVAKAAMERDDEGRFKAKPKSDKPRDNPNARIEQMRERQRIAEERAAALEAQLAAIKPKQAEPAKPAATPSAAFPAFDAWSVEHPDGTYEDYIDARTDFRFAQKEAAKLKENQVSSEAAAQAERLDAYDAKIQAETAKDPQWLNSIDPKLKALIPISALKPGDTPTFGNVLAEAIVRSDHPVGLLKHFTAHPDDAQRLSTLPPDAFFRALGNLEAKVETQMDAAPAKTGSAPSIAVSTANPPLKPVGNSPSVSDDEPPEDFDAYVAWKTRKTRGAR